MSIKTTLLDGTGQGYEAKISSRGQLIVAPLEFSTSYAKVANVINTAFNFVGPKADKQFVITDMILDAAKDVSNTTAGTIEIYEADSATETTVATSILCIEMIRNTNRIITGLNLILNEGKWLNIKTTDATISCTVMGYFVDA